SLEPAARRGRRAEPGRRPHLGMRRKDRRGRRRHRPDRVAGLRGQRPNPHNRERMSMPIELPDLDDIVYDTLVASAIAALPGYGSDWTDYNPSDPGITMLEMLAWLTEMLVYRTDRIQ